MKTRILHLNQFKNWNLKICFLFILFILFTTVTIAQVTDENTQSTNIPVIETEKQVGTDKEEDLKVFEKEEKQLALPIKKYTDTFYLTKEKPKGFTMVQDNDLIDPGVIYDEKWKKKKPVEEAGLVYEKEQYFGEHKIDSKFVTIVYRDFQVVDGDIIRVFANSDVIVPSAHLGSSFSSYKLDLKDGFNKIDFVALNQGDSGPNTAQFIIIDDKDNVIYNGGWNLATGGIATIMLVKE